MLESLKEIAVVTIDVTFAVGNKHPNLTIIMGLRKKLYKQKRTIYNYDLNHMKIPTNFSMRKSKRSISSWIIEFLLLLFRAIDSTSFK